MIATANLSRSVASVVMGLDALLDLVPLPSADGNAGRPAQYFNDQCVFDGRNHPQPFTASALDISFQHVA